MIENYGLK